MTVTGIDFSSRAVDVVLLDEDTDRAEWHRFELSGGDAFDRARKVRDALPYRGAEFWDDILAVGIEEPCGHGSGRLMRIQGAILACIPSTTLVHPLMPSAWRKTVGLPGNAPKNVVAYFVRGRIYAPNFVDWPQDACDAYCIALATRSVLEHGAAA